MQSYSTAHTHSKLVCRLIIPLPFLLSDILEQIFTSLCIDFHLRVEYEQHSTNLATLHQPCTTYHQRLVPQLPVM